MNTDESLISRANRFQRIALLVGVIGVAAGVIGAFAGNRERFFQAYLVAFLFWLGISLGSMAIAMIHYLTDSRWAMTLRRVNEAGASTLWLMAILFIPLLFDLRGLYIWARPEAVQADPILQQKSLYLNTPFFIARAAFYFVVWILLGYSLNRLSSRWAKGGDPQVKGRLQGLGAFGLIVYVITMSFAAIDWMMSLQPFWSSTVYGMIIIFGQVLSSLSFAILVLNIIPGLGIGHKWNFKTTPIPYKDLGAMVLTFVMGWAYVAYFQLLIQWAGNIPHEVSWYFDRSRGGWLAVGILVVILQFALPFVVLLTRHVRHNLRIMAWLGASIVVANLVEIYYEVIPAFHPGQFSLHWLDFVLPVGLGGLWVGAFLFGLKKRPALREAEQAALEPKPSLIE